MDKDTTSQLLTVTARAESQPVVGISQDDQKKDNTYKRIYI
jgi:hypothetical protein